MSLSGVCGAEHCYCWTDHPFSPATESNCPPGFRDNFSGDKSTGASHSRVSDMAQSAHSAKTARNQQHAVVNGEHGRSGTGVHFSNGGADKSYSTGNEGGRGRSELELLEEIKNEINENNTECETACGQILNELNAVEAGNKTVKECCNNISKDLEAIKSNNHALDKTCSSMLNKVKELEARLSDIKSAQNNPKQAKGFLYKKTRSPEDEKRLQDERTRYVESILGNALAEKIAANKKKSKDKANERASTAKSTSSSEETTKSNDHITLWQEYKKNLTKDFHKCWGDKWDCAKRYATETVQDIWEMARSSVSEENKFRITTEGITRGLVLALDLADPNNRTKIAGRLAADITEEGAGIVATTAITAGAGTAAKTAISFARGPSIFKNASKAGLLFTGRVKRGVQGPLKLFENKFPTHVLDRPNLVPLSQLKNINGAFNYVVTEDGRLLVGRRGRVPGRGHIDLANGQPVRAAGEVKVVNGEIKYIDNSSGHYLPSGKSAQSEAENAFKRLGFDTTGKYIEKVWQKDTSLQMGGAWRANQ